jgi:AcrR family transcriptional regulator
MPNERIRQQNVQRVLREAMNLFVANGVENTSFEMIARKSDLSLRSVQNYFQSKNDLIAAVLNRGYGIELEEMRAFFTSDDYLNKKGAGQVLAVVTAALNKAVARSEFIFCTAQMEHILSRAASSAEHPKVTENWQFLMAQLQCAFDKGASDGSIVQSTENELIDVKTIMLALRGIQEQVAFAMGDQTLKALFEPENAVKKYIRQIELMLTAQ